VNRAAGFSSSEARLNYYDIGLFQQSEVAQKATFFRLTQ